MLDYGEVCKIFEECPTGASTESKIFNVEADGLLLTLFVESISGTLDVNVYTLIKEGQEKLIDSFPQISAPTSALILRKQVEVHNHIRVEVITSDAVKYNMWAKGVSSGASSVRIEGADNWEVSKVTVSMTTNTIIIPAELEDRSGIAIRNTDFADDANILYVAESEAKLDAGAGYPVLSGEALQIDVKAGNVIYGLYSNADGPVNIIQTGG